MIASEPLTVAILGGCGRMGLALARVLLQETNVSVRLAGRDRAKLDRAVSELGSSFVPGRVTVCIADARDAEGLAAAVRGARLLAVCTTGAGHTAGIIRSVLEAGVDCIDLRYPQSVAREWCAHEADVKRAGIRVFIQAGHLPGLAGIFLRHLHAKNALIRNVVMATAIRPSQSVSAGAAEEMVDELRDGESGVFAGGRWVRTGRWRVQPVDLGAGFGKRLCVPMPLEELRGLPEEMHLDELAFFVAGFNGFVNGVVAPLVMTLGRLPQAAVRRMLASLMAYGIRRFAHPPFGAVMQIEARVDESSIRRMVAHHEDSYFFAAAAAVGGLNQYFDGSLARPGVSSMSRAADPGRLIRDMSRLGVVVEEFEAGNSTRRREQD
jgi:hypothetical protein